MTKWGQASLTLAIIVSIAFIALGVIYFQEIEKKTALEKQLEKIQGEKRNLEWNLKEKNETITKLNESIKEIEQKSDLKLRQKDEELTNFSQELRELTEEKGTLKNSYSKLKNARQKLESRLKQLKAEKEKLEQRLGDMEQKNETLLARLKTAGIDSPELNLEKIVVQQTPSWDGEILAVDNEYGYAVISFGINKGLTENVTLGIFRGKEDIGQGEVVKLYENTSVIKVIKKNKDILEGDGVKNMMEERTNRDF